MARTLIGLVTSDKADKTIVITVATRKTHPIYKKQYTVNTKFMAHDENNEAKNGDKVSIAECRPLSARKRFSLLQVLERGGARFEEKDAVADVQQPTNNTEEAPKKEPVKAKAKKAAPKESKE